MCAHVLGSLNYSNSPLSHAKHPHNFLCLSDVCGRNTDVNSVVSFFICGLYLYLVNKPLFGGWCIGGLFFFIIFRLISQDERTEIVPAYFLDFFCVSWYGIVNQLFNFAVNAFCKNVLFSCFPRPIKSLA